MIERVNKGDFIQRFVLIDRKENFTYEGRKALFQYLEQYEEDSKTQIEFDPIALCCEYSEYNNMDDFWKNGGFDKEEYPDLETLRDNTQVIEIEGTEGFIIQNF